LSTFSKISLLEKSLNLILFSKHFNKISNERRQKKIIGTKVTSKVTNVCSFPWCKSSYGLEFKTKQVIGIVEMVEYIRKTNIGPTQCYVKASFDFDNNNVKFNKIQLSQLKLFVENE
jgi:hypothetical protein